MTKEDVYRLAKAFEAEGQRVHTDQTRDMLDALRNVALRFWADTPEPKQD